MPAEPMVLLMEKDHPNAWWAPGAAPAVVRRHLFRRTFRWLVVLVVLAVPVTAAVLPASGSVMQMSGGAAQDAASAYAVAAGCTGYMTFPEPPEDQVGVWGGKKLSWRFRPPVSGNFSSTPAAPGFYETGDRGAPTLGDGVAALWQGRFVVWFNRNHLTDGEVDLLRAWSVTHDDVVVAEFPGTDDSWPEGRGLSITAWSRKQSCASFSERVLDSFVATQGAQAPGRPGVPLPRARTKTTVPEG